MLGRAWRSTFQCFTSKGRWREQRWPSDFRSTWFLSALHEITALSTSLQMIPIFTTRSRHDITSMGNKWQAISDRFTLLVHVVLQSNTLGFLAPFWCHMGTPISLATVGEHHGGQHFQLRPNCALSVTGKLKELSFQPQDKCFTQSPSLMPTFSVGDKFSAVSS